MNKTININLAGLFFHIDEDAYNKLQKYLASVRRSFSGMQGSEEVMSDIESRVAELFLEKRANEQQVISITHVEEVISIMGQPEDYEVDEEIFEGSKKSTASELKSRFSKPLYRDTLNGYIGGVCSGLAHFAGIDVIWVRIIFLLLSFVMFPFNVIAYIILWIVVKDAVSTSQRLEMVGKEVNISNIGDNYKADFDDVADGQTDAGYSSIVGQKGKRGTVKFFGILGKIIKGFFKAIVKIIGLFIFLAASIGLITLFFTSIGLGTALLQSNEIVTLFNMNIPENVSTWWMYLTALFFIGIPLLVLAILGLKLLVSNMKSIGRTAKVVLGLLWVASVISLCTILASLGTSRAFEGKVNEFEKFAVDQEKVFDISMNNGNDGNTRVNFFGERFYFNDNGDIQSKDIITAIAATTDSLMSINITYKAGGSSIERAKEIASQIEYKYTTTDSSIVLNDYFKLNSDKIRDNRIYIIINLPEGTKFKWNDRFNYRYSSRISNEALSIGGKSGSTFQIKNGKAVCLDCPVIEQGEDDGEWQYHDDNAIDEEDTQESKSTTTVTKKASLGGIEVTIEETKEN